MKMRKIFILALLLFVSILLSSCSIIFALDAWSNDRFGVFFKEKTLKSYEIADAPIPNLESSLIRDGKLYLCLTDEDYYAYIDELAEYFIASKSDCRLSLVYEVKQSSYWKQDCYYTPFDRRVLDEKKDGGVTFLYQYKENASKDFEESSPINLAIERYPENQDMSYTSFKYNTVMEIGGAYYNHKAISCLYGHTYGEEKEYIVPGEDRTVVSAKCTVCGFDSMSEELFTDEYRRENLITDEMVFDRAPKCKLYFFRDSEAVYSPGYASEMQTEFRADGICEVRIKNDKWYKYIVKVDGDEIPPSAVYEKYTSYEFAAPDEEANVVVYCCIADEPRGIFLGDLIPWIFDVKSKDIERVGVRKAVASSTIDSLVCTTYCDEESIFCYDVSYLRTVKLSRLSRYEGEREMLSVRVCSKDGSVYEADISGNVFFDGKSYYSPSYVPDFNVYNMGYTLYSLSTETGNGTVFGADGAELGKISNVNCLEFEKCEGGEYASLDTLYTVKTEAGDICAVNDTVFYIRDKYGDRHWFKLYDTDFSTMINDTE